MEKCERLEAAREGRCRTSDGARVPPAVLGG